MRIFPVFILLACSTGCGRQTAAPVAAVRPVKVVVASGAAVLRKDFAGMATPDDAVTLAFKLSGQISDVPVSQGEQVPRGALLAEMDPRDVELQVAAARSAFE
ncbi:MAG: biotin/lipoyl-binding protein, partial [Alistipes sp.]|nr:biotin/lipoyl-binding protein [Alistipes sp.]